MHFVKHLPGADTVAWAMHNLAVAGVQSGQGTWLPSDRTRSFCICQGWPDGSRGPDLRNDPRAVLNSPSSLSPILESRVSPIARAASRARVGRAGQKNPRTKNRTEYTENRNRRNQNRRSSVPVRFHDQRNRTSSVYSVLGLGSPKEPKFGLFRPNLSRPN